MVKDEKRTEATQNKQVDNKKQSNAADNVVREMLDEAILRKQSAEGHVPDTESYESDAEKPKSIDGSTVPANPTQIAANQNALNTEPWKPLPETGSTPQPKDITPKPVPQADQPQPWQSAKPTPSPSVEAPAKPGSSVPPSSSITDGGSIQPPPNQIVGSQIAQHRPIEQPQAPSASETPTSKLPELTPPPMEKTPPSYSNPISGPPPTTTIAQKTPDAVPGIVGDQPGSNRLIGQIQYGAPQERVQDNRQAVPVEGNSGVKEVKSDQPSTPMDKSVAGKPWRVPEPPEGAPYAGKSPSAQALIIITKEKNQQYLQDLEKYGQQEAIKRFYEGQGQPSAAGKVGITETTDQRIEKGGIKNADSQPVKTDSATKSELGGEAKSHKVDQSSESKTTRTESTPDGKGTKTDSSPADPKAIKSETSENKGGKSEVPNTEGKTTKPDQGTRPGEHAPTGGKIAETNPEGTRGGDIDKSGKVAETSAGSKTGDASAHRIPDGKTSDGPTNKGPEVGLVGKTSEAGPKGHEPSDKQQEGRTPSSPDKRGGADAKPQSADSHVTDRGGGLGSGWKGEQGSGKAEQGDSRKGEQGPSKIDQPVAKAEPPSPRGGSNLTVQPTKEGQSGKSDDDSNRTKRPIKEAVEQPQSADKPTPSSGRVPGGKADEPSLDRTDRRVPQPGSNTPIKGSVNNDIVTGKGDSTRGDSTKGNSTKSDTTKGDSSKGDATKGEAAKGDALRPNPQGEGKVADTPAATRKDSSKQTPSDEKSDGKPIRKQQDNPVLIPVIRGGGIPGVSIPEWLVKTDSKNPAKGDKGKEKEQPEQSTLTKKVKDAVAENQTKTAKQAPLSEAKDRSEKPRVDLLLPGKTRRDLGALVNDQTKKPSEPKRPGQTQQSDKEDAMLNQQRRKVPMQLAGRVTEPLPAVGKLATNKSPGEKMPTDETPVEKPNEKASDQAVSSAANPLGSRDAVMALLLGKGKGSEPAKNDSERNIGKTTEKITDKSLDKNTEDKQGSEANVPAVPRATISGVLGGPKKLTRRWQATESGTFKLNSSDSIKAINSGDVLPSERLTQQNPPRKPINWIRDQYAARQEQQSKQRRQYISQPGDHLGLVAVKTIGRTSPEVERLYLRLNPHLEMRRMYSEEHKTDVSILEPGSIIALPTWDEAKDVP